MSDLHQIQQFLPHSRFELATDAGAIAAAASPWWLPWLKEISEIAAALLPILGVVWLITQIGFRFYAHFKGKT